MTVITVQYDGGSSGSGPLTFGQDNMILCIRRDDPDQINKQAVWPVPPGAGLPEVLAVLRQLAERHESLRTRFPSDGPGGGTRQVVHAAGSFRVTLVEAGPEGELDALADELARKDRPAAFDLAADFPIRYTLLTRDGRPVRLAVVVCHSAADGAATSRLFEEWYTLLSGGELAPPSAPTPLEVAESERTPVGRRRATASLRHWEKILRTSPQAVFADSGITGPPGRVATLAIRSPSAAAALAAAAQRTGASPSSVLLGIFAALVAHRAAQPKLVIAALSANRHRSQLVGYVGTLAQDALLAVDTAAENLDEVIGRTKAAALAGYWHSTFDATRIWELIEDVAHLRGSRWARQVVVNDLSMTIPDAAAQARPMPYTDPELSWYPEEEVPIRVMLNIWRVKDCVELSLHTCPQVFDRVDSERLARGLLTLVEAAAAGPVALDRLTALTGLAPGVRDGEWESVDGSWIDLAAVRELLTHALGARVRPRVAVENGRLTARLDAGPTALTPAGVHLAVLAALSERQTAMAPQYYVIDGAVPAEGSGRDGGVTDWQALLG
ncbi:condensation domain-containing protein [Kitasatospora sp. Root187]|uniref:condensation domain-containing protein n=1 Tax=Kitasatospora sp. Root187 TaxID=1736486 RepID=UPI0009E864EA|nr:condensation domain-containing protein [Kitasatospora sp. Root187]